MPNENTLIPAGDKITFYQLLEEQTVQIPTIQRDYTYGSGTASTDKVLNQMLDDIRLVIDGVEQEHTFDFIYGNDNIDRSFVPLDGQQRLTTLFLLHLYAWLREKADETRKKGQRLLGRFSYATRKTTELFCHEMVTKFSYQQPTKKENAEKEEEENNKPVCISKQIEEYPFFIPSFSDDPSIRSMLYVLDRIEERFHGNQGLWECLTSPDCGINFYRLNFGKFDLSDDLYIKMNSRGKPLTTYEIFKSSFEKYIENKFSKDAKDYIAQRLDVEWADMVWNEMGRDIQQLDKGFVNLFQNIFILLDATRRYGVNVSAHPLAMEVVKTQDDLDFITSFFNDFLHIYSSRHSVEQLWRELFYSDNAVTANDDTRVRLFTQAKNNLFREAMNHTLVARDLIVLYALYLGIHDGLPTNDFQQRLRHIRNLIENSLGDQIKAENVAGLLADTQIIMQQDILQLTADKATFSSVRLEEEQEKERHKELWSKLFVYENHTLLRGALSLFRIKAKSLFDNGSEEVLRLLQTFTKVFDNQAESNDRKIRAALLAVEDYSQSPSSEPRKKIIGNRFRSWNLMFVKSQNRRLQERIINVIDWLSQNDWTLDGLLSAFKDTADWRYYAIRYYEDIYRFYTHSEYYGYLYLPDEKRPLETLVLQSTQESQYNVEWKILNLILASQLGDFNMAGRSSIDFTVRAGMVKLDAFQEGWRIHQLTEEQTQSLAAKGYQQQDGIYTVPASTDFVQFAVQILQELAIYP